MPRISAVRKFFTPKHIAGEKVTFRDVINAPYLRLAVLTSSAATVAYFVGANSSYISGTTAAITALISVRHTFHDSIRESFTQIIGVLIGGTVAFVAIKLIGFNSFVVLLAIFTCFIAARLLKLGEEGAIVLGVTLILVLGPRTSSGALDSIEQRFLGVLFGASLAIVVSYFVRRGTPQGRALQAGISQSMALSALLHTISDSLAQEAGKLNPALAKNWLAQAERITEEIELIKVNAESAVEGARGSPVIDRREATAILNQIKMTETTAATVVNICRELVMTFGSSSQLPTLLASALAGVLSATANVISDQAEVAEDEPSSVVEEDQDNWEEKRDQAIKELRDLDETQPLLIGGSILRDAEKINDLLT
jgi:hypothetical protein